ncbi:MAG: LytR C-terminal domain-containing protein [Ilumatobacteraceae bacterium]
MTNDDPSAGAAATGGTGRTPRQGSGGSPVGSTLSIVLAVVAVVAGFLILRNITDDGGSGEASSGVEIGEPVTTGANPTTTFDVGGTTTTTTTTIPRVTEGAIVVVANANTVGGSAGRMTKTLETVGYMMGDPVNATVTLDDSLVYYDASNASAEAVAQSVGIDMGCLDVAAAPTPPPTSDGSLGEAGVLVVLGNNEADKTIDEMAIAGCGATEAPAVSGSSDEPVAPTTTEG